MATAAALARVFKVLSVDTRVRIVQLLKERTLCVNALAARLDITPAAVSQHLRILRDAGLVSADKQGYFVQMAADPATNWRFAGPVYASPQTINLDAGLNLVSAAPDYINGGLGCQDAEAEIESTSGGTVTKIIRWTGVGWQTYDPSLPPSPKFDMYSEQGYFIQMAADPASDWTMTW